MEIIKKHPGIWTILILGCLPLLPLLHPGFPITHDGQDHVARIANFYQSLTEGNIIPRWAANLNWGYGHPILMFLYPLPSYLASLFHFLGFSFINSVKIVFGLTYILSGFTMYLWIKNIFGEKAGILSGILYMYAPYRFVDFYVRGALGEHVAFLFVPLVFYFFLKQSKTISYWNIAGGALAISCLILSHNAFAVMFLPVAFLYALILWYRSKKKKILAGSYILTGLLGFGLSAFFIVPAFFEGKYTLRDVVTNHSEYKQGFVNLADFFSFSWSYGGTAFLSKQIGIVQIISIILGSLAFFTSKRKNNVLLYTILIVSFFVSIFLMLPQSNFFWENITLIQKFQFPWRFLSVVVFVTAGLSAFMFFARKSEHMKLILVVIFCSAAVIFYFPYYKANGYLLRPESFYTGIYKSTTDTGESSPVWSVRFMEHTAKAPSEVISGDAIIKDINRNSTTHEYYIIASQPSRIRENTLYFPGWNVSVDGKNVPVEFQDVKNRGLMTYNINKGSHHVLVHFTNTKLRNYSEYITGFSLIMLCGFGIFTFFKRK